MEIKKGNEQGTNREINREEIGKNQEKIGK